VNLPAAGRAQIRGMTQRTQIAGWDRLFYGIDKMNKCFASETLAGKWTKRDASTRER